MPRRKSSSFRRFVSRVARSLTVVSVALTVAGCASSLERARKYKDQKDYARSEQYYRTSISSDPEDRAKATQELAALKLALAHHKLKKGDAAAAEALFREALELTPGEEKATDGLGRALAEQGKTDAAIAVLQGEGGEKCGLCRRYLAVLLVERGWARETGGDAAGARVDYEQANTLVPEVSTALAIARMAEVQADGEGLIKAIEAAVPLIKDGDEESQRQFKAMREKAVMAAAARGDLATVDRWLNFFPPGAGGDEWYVLQYRVAQQMRLENKVDEALARARHMLTPKYEASLPAAKKADFEKMLADIYRLQGVKFLREGKIVEADDNFRQAMEFAPTDNKIKLLRALAIAGMNDVKKALEVVAALPKDTKGHNEVLAILESMTVHARLAEGDVEAAKAALARAQAAHGEQPEVHVALAEILTVSPIENLPKKVAKELKKSGMVRYPNDAINRYGEALSELAWAREQAKGLGEGHLFRGPGSDGRMDKLEQRIRAFYPFAVEFNPDSTAILQLRGSGGQVTVRGPGDLEEQVSIPAGGSSEVVVREPGLVTLRVGSRTMSLWAEPYTKLKVQL
jgi:tetratricopeptide (TPR) repeat protein